jgi:16S rRNA (cytosine967-C5)-methyltransferase
LEKTDVRRLAFEILSQVEEGAFSDQALDGTLRQHPDLADRDRRLLTELVYGVLRYRGRLDFVLSHFCRQPLSRVEPAVLQLLRLGSYQLLLLDRIPPRAAVHETVELARALGLARVTGFLNGILRALLRGLETLPWPDPQLAPAAYLQQVLSLPAWLAQRWLDDFGPAEGRALAEAMLEPAPFTVRVNPLKTSRESFLAALEEAGYQAAATRFAPEGVSVTGGASRRLPGDREGWYQVQDEGSMLIARLLDPRPGERLLDACAAPGGKTTHLAALTDNRADILALDISADRLALVGQGAKRLGCHGIITRAWDLTEPADFLAADSFDRILLDAPCSGLGVLRRNPESRWRRTAEDLRANGERQSTLLNRAASLVRPGGRLLYSVCTLSSEETTAVAERFLAGHVGFEREDLRVQAPSSWRELFDEQGALRTLPHRHGGMDAFYAVSFRRRD